MANVLVNDASLADIADAIREKNGTEETYKPSEMGDAVRAIQSGGGDSYYDTFWDTIQNYGNRTNYKNEFESDHNITPQVAWNDEIFKPKYDIDLIQSDNMFKGSLITDLSKLEININAENLISCGAMFAYCNVLTEGIPLYMSNTDVYIASIYRGARAIEKIELYDLPDLVETKSYAYAKIKNIHQFSFDICLALKDVFITGVIISSMSFKNSNLLTIESAKRIIGCLKDYTGMSNFEGLMTLSFNADTWALLDAEGNASPNGNTWKEYITDLGWLFS